MTREKNNTSITVDFRDIASIGPVVELQGPSRTFRARVQLTEKSGGTRFLSRKQFGKLMGSARACTPLRSFQELPSPYADKAATFLMAARPVYAALRDKNRKLQSDYFAAIAQ